MLKINRYKFLLVFFYLSFAFFTAAKAGEVEKTERIVVIAPAIAEMLEALDLDRHVVGRGEYGPWPMTIELQPIVGGYNNPNAELVVELNATIVLNTASQAASESHKRLKQLNIEVMEFDTSTMSGVFHTLIELGKRFNRIDKAKDIRDKIKASLDNIRSKTTQSEKKTTLFVVGNDPMFVAGPGSHIDYLITLVGGKNIIHDGGSAYQQVSMETLLERQPEIIIDASGNSNLYGRQNGNWQKWKNLPAIQNQQVHWIDSSLLLIPGIRLVEMAELMGKLIQPDIFGKPSTADYINKK